MEAWKDWWGKVAKLWVVGGQRWIEIFCHSAALTLCVDVVHLKVIYSKQI